MSGPQQRGKVYFKGWRRALLDLRLLAALNIGFLDVDRTAFSNKTVSVLVETKLLSQSRVSRRSNQCNQNNNYVTFVTLL